VYAVVDAWELPRLRERYAGTRFASPLSTPVFEAGAPKGIMGQVYDVTGTTAGAGAH
jgi:hypothetical protein